MISLGVLTISDKGSKGQRDDLSGPEIKKTLQNKLNIKSVEYIIIPDDFAEIRSQLKNWADIKKIDLIITTGGTGLTPRDITPEATKSIIDREIPGIAEALRFEGFKYTHNAILSRGIAGIRGNTLIINLPGSVKGVQQGLQTIGDILEHALSLIKDQNTEH